MKAKSMAGAILGIVALFVFLVAGTLIAKSRTAPVESAGSTASSADLRIKDAQIDEESGGVRWQLKAEQALIFDGEGRTSLRNISVSVFERSCSLRI